MYRINDYKICYLSCVLRVGILMLKLFFYYRDYFVLVLLEEFDEGESLSSLEWGIVFNDVYLGVMLKKDKYCFLLFGDFIEEVELYG